MIDWQTVIIASIAATPGALAGVAAVVVSVRTHKAVNSRMDTLLKIATDKATAEATIAEKERGRQKTAPRKR